MHHRKRKDEKYCKVLCNKMLYSSVEELCEIKNRAVFFLTMPIQCLAKRNTIHQALKGHKSVFNPLKTIG